MVSVDVVIPNYNYASLLPECVDSILGQGVEDLRIIIIDNASKDNSVAVAERLAASCAKTIEIMRHAKNIGPHGSFNEGIDLARADYFMILCADDVLAPGALPLALAALEANREASCAIGTYAGSGARDPHQAVTGTAAYTLLPGAALIARACRSSGRGIPAHSMLVRRTVQHKVGHYRPSLPYMDDLELLLRFARVGPIVELAMPLAVQRYHKGNLSEEIWGDRLRDLKERRAVFASFFNREGEGLPGAAGLYRMARRRLVGSALWFAAGCLRRRDLAGALDLFKLATQIGRSERPAPLLAPHASAFPESADGKPS